ncbi:hypothetical protein MRB53_013695 [Persea americana]|uniref:Uncharacterized protein n=1 Tax=Persea americana TaxID=3435 RepID=A0ACC2K8R4_PERAE|nr:hypothetical protein MRB53_013695 [Persea americana]
MVIDDMAIVGFGQNRLVDALLGKRRRKEKGHCESPQQLLKKRRILIVSFIFWIDRSVSVADHKETIIHLESLLSWFQQLLLRLSCLLWLIFYEVERKRLTPQPLIN